MALSTALGAHNLPAVAVVIGSLCDAVTTLLLYLLARRLGFERGWALFVATLFALSAGAIVFTNGGMETPLFTLLVVATVSAAAVERPLFASGLAGLATLTRPEGLLLRSLIVVSEILRRRRPWPTLTVFLVSVLPWAIFATAYFGSPLPQSLTAKAAVYQQQGSVLRQALWPLAQLGMPGTKSFTSDS